MASKRIAYLGIDPTPRRMIPVSSRQRKAQRVYLYAAVDQDLDLVALSESDLDGLTAFIAGQESAVVAVSGPRRPNQGLMTCDEVRARLTPAPATGRWQNLRVAEYELRHRNISAAATPAQEGACARWVRSGFEIYRRLVDLGYQAYPANDALRQWLEVNPQASFCALLGLSPFPRESLEGRLQRQLVLNEQGVNIPDPMDFFEEVTPHKLLKGILPVKNIYSDRELDALVGAYTAWIASNEPEAVTLLGEVGEGQVVVPVREMRERY